MLEFDENGEADGEILQGFLQMDEDFVKVDKIGRFVRGYWRRLRHRDVVTRHVLCKNEQ